MHVAYAKRDIYLLDDPLPAVNAHAGMHIFEHCIKEALKKKNNTVSNASTTGGKQRWVFSLMKTVV